MKKKKKTGKFRSFSSLVFLMIMLPFVIFVVNLQIGLSSKAADNTFYIDCTAGSDNNPGTSQTSAWQTLSKINSATSGDIVSLKKGCNWDGGINISVSGITVNTYGDGDAPTIQNAGGLHVIELTGSNITFDGVTVHNATRAGINSAENTTANIIRNVEMYNVGFGVELFGSGHKVFSCNAHDLHMVNNTEGGDDDYGAVGYNVIANDVEIAYSKCINCTAPSYDYERDGGFVEVWNYGDNLHVHHNYAENTEGFFELGAENGTYHANNIRVEHNILYNSLMAINVHTGDNFAIQVNDFTFYNNTVVQDKGGFGQINFPGVTPQQLIVRNNIFSLGGINVSNGGDFTHTNNVYFNTEGLTGDGEVTADPQFVNVGAKDFHLTADSPAVDAGADVGLTMDYENNAIPANGKPDIGAYEYGSSAITPSGANLPTTGVDAPTMVPALLSPTMYCLGPCSPSGDQGTPGIDQNPSSENNYDPNTMIGPNQNGNNGNGRNGFFGSIYDFFMQIITIIIVVLTGGN